MRTALIGTLILLSSWLAVPAAHSHGNWDNRDNDPGYQEYRHDLHEIQRMRVKLQRDREERQQALRVYNEARRVGDWATMRYEQDRLDRLDRRIEHHEYELRRAMEQARQERYERHDEWRASYGYNRY